MFLVDGQIVGHAVAQRGEHRARSDRVRIKDLLDFKRIWTILASINGPWIH